MKFLKTLGLVSIVGVGLFTIAIATMDFTERGFNYIAEPVGEEGEAPEFEITDEMRQEAESQIENVVDEIESELTEETSIKEEEIQSEEIPEPIWIGENPNETNEEGVE